MTSEIGRTVPLGTISIANHLPFVLIAGPCQIESRDHALETAAALYEVATATGVPLTSGVYAGLLGPTYETPSEVRMLERVGADATGMSTIPETVVAAAIGMEVAGISLITNQAAGISTVPLDHADVVEVGHAAAKRFADLVTEFVRRLSA